MSGKARDEYIDVTQQSQGGYIDATKKDAQSLGKHEESRAESSRARDAEGTPPPLYGDHGDLGESAGSSHDQAQSAAPPYRSLEEDVSADMHALLEGDPNDTIPVPMIHSTEKKSLKNLFMRDLGKVSQTVIVRKMPRHHYLKHYAKDAEGNYIGTGRPAADAGLVFVPSKSTPEDILQQVRKVAFGKQHYANEFGSSYVGAAGVVYT